MKRTVLISVAMGFATVFGPAGAVELPAALQAARQADPMLLSAEANRDAARENIAIARARLLPQISAQTTQQLTHQTTKRDGGETTFSGPSSSSQITLRQAVFRRRDFAGLELAQLQALYGEVKLSASRAEHWNRVVGAWLDVLASMAVRDVQARSVSALTRTAEQEQRRFERGDGTLLKAEAATKFDPHRFGAAGPVERQGHSRPPVVHHRLAAELAGDVQASDPAVLVLVGVLLFAWVLVILAFRIKDKNQRRDKNFSRRKSRNNSKSHTPIKSHRNKNGLDGFSNLSRITLLSNL